MALTSDPDYADPWPFNARHATQVQNAMLNILTDIYVLQPKFTPDNMNKRNITKEREVRLRITTGWPIINAMSGADARDVLGSRELC